MSSAPNDQPEPRPKPAYQCPTCHGVHGNDPCSVLVPRPPGFHNMVAEWASFYRDQARQGDTHLPAPVPGESGTVPGNDDQHQTSPEGNNT